jgi:hypothetical protein
MCDEKNVMAGVSDHGDVVVTDDDCCGSRHHVAVVVSIDIRA